MDGKVLAFNGYPKSAETSPYRLIQEVQAVAEDFITERLGGEQVDSVAILSQWRTFLAANYATKTVTMYTGTMMRFLTDVAIPVSDVTEQDVMRWLEGKTTYRSASRSTYFMALRSCYSWMVRNHYIDTDPTAFVRVPPREEKQPRALTEDQYEAVRKAAFDRSAIRGWAVELLYYTGGRVGEVCSLRWEDVDLDLDTGGVTFRHTKTGKDRVIPMSHGLRRCLLGLKSHFGERTCVLPRATGTVHGWCQQAGRAAGIKKVHPHLFRSTAATRMMQKGARVDAVQANLGHTKLTTTQRYLEVNRADKRAAINLL